MRDGQVELQNKHVDVESLNPQVDAAVHFATYLVSRYPQVDDNRNLIVEAEENMYVRLPTLPDFVESEPLLNYYLAGSLATALLAKAETIDICAETEGARIDVTKSIPNPPEARALFAEFARPVGDIDYVPTDHYTIQKRAANADYRQVTTEEFENQRKNYLWKGGGGPTFGEIPVNARAALKKTPETDDSVYIMSDPVETYGAKKFAKVAVDGHDFYITRPDTIIVYKMLHMLQSYDQKPTQFNGDFVKLYHAITKLFPEQELIALTQETLGEYEERSAQVSSAYNKAHEPVVPRMINNLLAKKDLNEEARGFLEKIKQNNQSSESVES